MRLLKRLLSVGLFSRVLLLPIFFLMSLEVFAGSRHLASFISNAVAYNPVVKARYADIEQANYRVDFRKWAFYPSPEIAMSRGLWGGGAGSESLSLGVSQPLWVGGELRAALEGAESASKTAYWALEESRLELAQAVLDAYGDWLSAHEKIEAWSENYESLRELREQIKRRLSAGVASQSDLSLIESRLAAVGSELSLYVSEAEVNRAKLQELAGETVTDDRLNELLAEPIPQEPSLREALGSLVSAHPSVRRAACEILEAQANLAVSRAQKFPRVTLQARRVLSQFDRFDGDNQVLLQVESRFGPGLSFRSQEMQAQAGVGRAEEEKRAVVLQTRETILTQFLTVQTLSTRIPMVLESLAKSQEVFSSYRRQYLTGTRSWLDVVSAASDVLSIQGQVIDARVNHLVVSWKLSMNAYGMSSILRGQS